MKRVHSRESASSEKKKKKISVKLKSSSDGKSSKSIAKAKGTTKGKATTDADQFSLEAVLENGGNMAEYDRLKVRRAVCSYRVAQQRPEGGPCNHTRWARSKSVQFHQKGGVAAFFLWARNTHVVCFLVFSSLSSTRECVSRVSRIVSILRTC